MSFVEANGIVLHARRLGDRKKPLVVLSNSLGTDARIWDDVVPALLEHYGVLLYDKRGHGLSEAPAGPSGLADHAADLMGLVDAIGEPRFALVGLSVGGMIAQIVAAAHPDRVAALVLCDTAAKIGDAAGWDTRIAAVRETGLDAIAPGIFERWFTATYRQRQTIAMRGWHAMLTRQPVTGYAATCEAIRDADLRSTAPAIRAPTLLVVGEEDGSTPPALVRETAALIHNARFEIIAGAGHMPCIEQPTVLARLILDHLAVAGFR